MQKSFQPEISIVLVSHQEYLPFLPLVIKAWDSFAPKNWRKILSLDGCAPPQNFEGWEVVVNSHSGNPILPRNSGLDLLKSGFVIFWDGDNIPTKEYVDAVLKVTSVESDVFCWYPTMDLPYEESDLRFHNFVDTASVFSVDMLKSIGGWAYNECLQDWLLILKAKQHGFKIERLDASFVYVRHNKSLLRSSDYKRGISTIRSVGIICPMRGDRTLSSDWFNNLKQQNLNFKTGLTIVDKSGDPLFNKWLWSQLSSINIDRIALIVDEPVPGQDFESIHNSVGKSYALAFNSTPEDLILTWEDDVLPESSSAISNLIMGIYPLSPYHVVSASVPRREDPSLLIATPNKEKWGAFETKNFSGVKETGLVGGGFTLWLRPVLEEFGFQGMRWLNGFPAGWDGWLCRRINSKYKIGLSEEPCSHKR